MSSAAAGLFLPQIRCSILKYIRYSRDFAPLCAEKNRAGLLLPIESVLPLMFRLQISLNLTNVFVNIQQQDQNQAYNCENRAQISEGEAD